MSFVVVSVGSRLIVFDRSIEEAAQDLGANGIQTFFRVTLPLIAPAVLAAAAHLRALDRRLRDHELQRRIDGHLPALYLGRRASLDPVAGELAAMIFLFTLVMMIFTVWQQRRAERLAAVRPEEG